MRGRVLGVCIATALSGCSLLTSFSELTGGTSLADGAAPSADAQAGGDASVIVGTDGSPVPVDGSSAGATLLIASGYKSDGTFAGDAWTSTINADGSLSAWQSVTSLPHHCARGDVARAPGASFFIGGLDDLDKPTQTAFRPVLSMTGLSWAPQMTLSVPRWRTSAAYANGFVYALGGTNYTDGSLASVEFAGVGSDGTLTPWTTTTSLPAPTTGAPATSVLGQLIVVAGTTPDAGDGVSTVLIAQQGKDGSLGAWSQTTPLPRADEFGKLVHYGSRLYYLPGYSGGSPLFADVSAGGVGPWTPAPKLPISLIETEAIIIGSTLYVIGGTDATTMLLSDHVYYANIAADGSLGSWQAGRTLPIARSFIHAAQL